MVGHCPSRAFRTSYRKMHRRARSRPYRPDYGLRNDAFPDLAEVVVEETLPGPSGAPRFSRRYAGESPALCAACGLHF